MTQNEETDRPSADTGSPTGARPMPNGGSAPDNGEMNGGIQNGLPMLVARGFGGRVELYFDRIRIVRDGLVNYLLLTMGGQLAQVDTVIPVEKVSSVDITTPLIWNDYLTISFPGSPPQVGRPIVDATAENAIFLNFFDNRDIHDLVQILRRRMSAPVHVTMLGERDGRTRWRRRIQSLHDEDPARR